MAPMVLVPPIVFAAVIAAGAPTAAPTGARSPASPWRPITQAVEYGTFELPSPGGAPAGTLHVVRIESRHAHLTLVTRAEVGGPARTAARWSAERNLVVAINAGMFQTDERTNVGFMRSPNRPNNRRWSSKYQSVFVLDPTGPDAALPQAQIVDRDAAGAGFEGLVARYGTVIQNLRLVKSRGRNVWTENGRAWSEAAVGMDGAGRILFLFSRAPLSMFQWNRAVTDRTTPVGQALDLVNAMHVEGGPEASLSIHGGGVDLDLAGSYETGFLENDGNPNQWPIPNVLGVVRDP